MTAPSVLCQAELERNSSVVEVRTMLKVFKQIRPELTTASRTLLELPRRTAKKAVGTGKYINWELQ